MWTIKESVLINAITAANNYLPDEFVCLLGGDKKKQLIEEIVFVPSETGPDAAHIDLLSIPFDSSILGSLHSHPYSYAEASNEDKRFFQRYALNIILGHPYALENISFFDKNGRKIEVLITKA
jgi:proteasome lid subunit RPN8/RPN11